MRFKLERSQHVEMNDQYIDLHPSGGSGWLVLYVCVSLEAVLSYEGAGVQHL